MYFSENTINKAILDLRGNANHLLKIWFVLKVMGLDENNSIVIDTNNSTPYIRKIFSCGAPDGSFYIPFSHTRRFAFMKRDAARSIIQTTLQRWASSGSVVTCDPTGFLKIDNSTDNKLTVRTARQYPLGLGYGLNGFAMDEDRRVTIPDLQFAIWIFAQKDLESPDQSSILHDMKKLLNISDAESNLIFIQKEIETEFQTQPIDDQKLYNLCLHAFDEEIVIQELNESYSNYTKRVKNMVTISAKPTWLTSDPTDKLRTLINQKETAILLYGPPRTGKTRAIDLLFPRDSSKRSSIQLHEGWGYDNLILGLYPSVETNKFEWKKGVLLQSIQDNKKVIVLEEVNRTNLSQSLGEVFSLLEKSYRGERHKILLPNGEYISIPEDTLIIFTMNTIDSSTEDIDDALIGRMASVYFPPRIEDLNSLLNEKRPVVI